MLKIRSLEVSDLQALINVLCFITNPKSPYT